MTFPAAATSPRLAWLARSPLALAGAALLASFVLYGSALPFGFTFDDADMVASNPLLAEPDLVRIFRSPIMPPQQGVPNDLYRPLGVASLALDHRIGGGATWAYRLSNAVLHALASLLVIGVARGWGASRATALCAAVIFLVHPIHSEAVLQIKGRFELLAAALGLGAIVAATRLRQRRMRAAIPLALWIGAMLSKESALGLALLAPLLVATSGWSARGESSDRPARRTGAVVAVLGLCAAAVAAVLALRLNALGTLARPAAVHLLDNPLAHVGAAERLWTSLDLVWRYARLMAFPIRLSADYSYAAIEPRAFPAGTGAWLGLAIVVVTVVWFARAWRARDRFTVASLALIAGPYAVVSNALLPIGTIFGERLVYLPSTGVCLLAARAIVELARRPPRSASDARSVAALAGLVLVLLAVRTSIRVPDWSNNLRLFEAALDVNPRSAKMLAWVGRGHLERNDLEAAIPLLRRASELVPHWIDPRVHLARALIFLDRIDDAERELDVAAADAPPGEPWIPYHRGLIALRRERFADAASQFALADRPPWAAAARFNLGYAQLRAGAPLDAAQTYVDAVRRFPEDRRLDRELPRLREALAAIETSAAVEAGCGAAPTWARAWLATLDAPGLLSDRLARGAPPPRPPCESRPVPP